jgi:hypothetical protein
VSSERAFPLQYQRDHAPHPSTIPWSVAELAYSVYAGRYGTGQSLERLAQRGGFGPGEMDLLLPGWRERVGEVVELRGEVQRLAGLLEKARRALAVWVDGFDLHAEEIPYGDGTTPCPGDDTCRCLAASLVNDAMRGWSRPTEDEDRDWYKAVLP